jgi:hypothetical protein
LQCGNTTKISFAAKDYLIAGLAVIGGACVDGQEYHRGAQTAPRNDPSFPASGRG